MISRIYIDNCRCFTDFEYRPKDLQLLLGPNGTGKTTAINTLEMLRAFIAQGYTTQAAFPNRTLTAWDSRSDQTFELGLRRNGAEYSYRLVIEHERESPRNRIVYEDLTFDGRPLCRFEEGKVQLFGDDGSRGPAFPFEASRSAISTVPEGADNKLLSWFRWRLDRVLVLYPDPLRMSSRSDEKLAHPDPWLHELASWIRYLHHKSPEITGLLSESLREDVLDHFIGFRFADKGEGTQLLEFDFAPSASDPDRGEKPYTLGLGKLSTGQRALVGLYTMLHAAVGPDMTLCIDEPDNYVALREIQPWLLQLTDKVQDTGGQCLLVSHHPELINYLASDRGVQFFREGGGPVRARPFEWSGEDVLLPAEIVARGWEGP